MGGKEGRKGWGRAASQNNNLPTQRGRGQKSLAGGQERDEKDGDPHGLMELCFVVWYSDVWWVRLIMQAGWHVCEARAEKHAQWESTLVCPVPTPPTTTKT